MRGMKNMSIEKYWLDGVSYYVEFLVVDGRCIKKEIIVPVGMTQDAIVLLVKKSFKDVVEVIVLECISDVLCAKEFPKLKIKAPFP